MIRLIMLKVRFDYTLAMNIKTRANKWRQDSESQTLTLDVR